MQYFRIDDKIIAYIGWRDELIGQKTEGIIGAIENKDYFIFHNNTDYQGTLPDNSAISKPYKYSWKFNKIGPCEHVKKIKLINETVDEYNYRCHLSRG